MRTKVEHHRGKRASRGRSTISRCSSATGPTAVNPYLAYEAIELLVARRRAGHRCPDRDPQLPHGGQQRYSRRSFQKWGSPRCTATAGAQIFEALGLGEEVIDQCFTGTASRIGGVDLDTLSPKKRCIRHREAFTDMTTRSSGRGGVYQWKRDGEFHLWNPESIAALQDAVRNEDYGRFKDFSRTDQ